MKRLCNKDEIERGRKRMSNTKQKNNLRNIMENQTPKNAPGLLLIESKMYKHIRPSIKRIENDESLVIQTHRRGREGKLRMVREQWRFELCAKMWMDC